MARSERDRPLLPISLFFLRHVAHRLAVDQWEATPGARGKPFPAFIVDRPAELQSAIREPYATVGDEDLYPTVLRKAACLFRGLVKNHGLRDGNKRLAVTTVGVFMRVNGRTPTFTPEQLWKYALRVARHEGAFPMRRIERWLRTHSIVTPSPEREQFEDTVRRLLRDPSNTVEFVVTTERLSVLGIGS